MNRRPKIRHLAIITLDPERLAKFYEQTFDMTRLKAERGVPGSKAVYMTDGYITLAILENKPRASLLASIISAGMSTTRTRSRGA